MRRWLPLLLATAVTLAGTAAAAPALEQRLITHLPMRADLRDRASVPQEVEVSGRVSIQGRAAVFGGKEDWLELPHIALHDRAFTVAVWLKPGGAGPTYGIVEQWDRSERGRILHLMIRDGLRPWFGFYMNDVASPVSLVNDGTWQHVAFRYDGAQQEIWINGRLVCRRKANAYRGTEGKTCIGKNPNWHNVPGRDYEGGMSDFRIYERALSFEEIALLASTPPDLPRSAARLPLAAQPAGSVAPAGASDVPLLTIDAAKMRLRGKPGEEYIVEASDDLVRWVALDTVVISTEGVVDFVDEDAHLFQQRFYRIRYRVP